MFWVWDERCTNTEDQLWVDFNVGVFCSKEEWNFQLSNFNGTIWHSNFCFQDSIGFSRLSEVSPANLFVSNWTAREFPFWNSFWKNEWTRSDVEVFFFFSIYPFNDTIIDEIFEGNVTCSEIDKMMILKTRCTIV